MRVTLAIVAFYILSAASMAAVNHNHSALESYSGNISGSFLYKRRGGGSHGGGGRGGGGHGAGGRGGRGGRTSAGSNAGGISHKGSGTQPAYGSGKNGDPRVYGGGVIVPYSAGGQSPTANLNAKPVPAKEVIFLWPGYWGTYSVYFYPYHQPYSFRNESAKRTETFPVICLCTQYAVCGCDETARKANLRQLIGTGHYKKLDRRMVLVTSYQRRKTIFLNGTLTNGTTRSDAPGALGYSSGFCACAFASYCISASSHFSFLISLVVRVVLILLLGALILLFVVIW